MFFEELPEGFRFATEPVEMTREAIVDFARDWDPQPFHLDEDAAAASHFGTLIASGWHTLLVAFTASMRAGIWDEASMGSPGMDEVRWLRPVTPGDRIHVEAEVIRAEASKSRPDRGRTAIRYQVLNQNGETVASFIGHHILKTQAEG